MARHLKLKSFIEDRNGNKRPLAPSEHSLKTSDLRAHGGSVIHEIHDDDGKLILRDASGNREGAEASLRVFQTLGDSPAANEDRRHPVLDATYAELTDDRDLLDQVIRILVMSIDTDYVSAMDKLGTWADATGLGRNATLRQMLEHHSRVGVASFERDLAEMSSAADAIADRLDRELTSWDGPEPDPETGLIHSDAVTRARPLADPAKFEEAFQLARDLEGAEPGEDGREAFRKQLQVHADAGVDYLSTLQYRAHQRTRAERLNELETKTRQREILEREKRAGRADALRRIEDASRDLRLSA